MQQIVNPFVYDLVITHKLPNPTIPPWIGETYAQCYEDVTILQLLYAYLTKLGRKEASISYVEIGANHPVCTSCFFLLQRTFGVRGILVEPNPKLAADLKKFRPDDVVIDAAVVATEEKQIDLYINPENELSTTNKNFVDTWEAGVKVQEKITVNTVRVNELLEQISAAEIMLLSIDVEGSDYEILTDIDYAKHRPFVILIEPSDHIIKNNSARISKFMKEQGYTLVIMNYVNMIFVDSEKLNA